MTTPAAGYSGKSLEAKLGVKPGMQVAVIDAPAGFRLVGATGARVKPELDLILVFVTKRSDLARRWPALTKSLVPNGALWVAWPKKAAAKTLAIATDMSEDVVRAVALPTGWVDVKVCAVDTTWSALKCVLRVENR